MNFLFEGRIIVHVKIKEIGKFYFFSFAIIFIKVLNKKKILANQCHF